MEEKKSDSISFDESVCTTSSESSQLSLQREEIISIADGKIRLELWKSIGKIKSSFTSGECSKTCTKYKESNSKKSHMSDCKSETYLTHQKKFNTKPSDEASSLSDRLKRKMKGTSKKLQSALPFLEKATRSTVEKIKSLYENFRPRQALGFKCDLKKCRNTLKECSLKSCKKKRMVFGEPANSQDTEMIDSGSSDSSTISSASKLD